MNSVFQVERGGRGAEGGGFLKVEGLEGKGWVNLEKVSFVVAEGGGMAVDDVVYKVRGVDGGGGCG